MAPTFIVKENINKDYNKEQDKGNFAKKNFECTAFVLSQIQFDFATCNIRNSK